MSKYTVGTAINSVVGENNVVVQTRETADVEKVLRLLATMQVQPKTSDEDLVKIQADLTRANEKLDMLQAGQSFLLTCYNQSEERIIATLVQRMELQEIVLTHAIVEALETDDSPAAVLDHHLTVLNEALVEIQAQGERIEDRQLAADAAKVAEAIAAPGLGIKHKLKIGAPIIPGILAYEGEVDLGTKVNLEATWTALQDMVRRKLDRTP